MHGSPTQSSPIRKTATTLLLYSLLAGAAVLYGETQLRPSSATGVFWLKGQHWWALDYWRCTRCGGELVAIVDEASPAAVAKRANYLSDITRFHPRWRSRRRSGSEAWASGEIFQRGLSHFPSSGLSATFSPPGGRDCELVHICGEKAAIDVHSENVAVCLLSQNHAGSIG